MTNNAQEEDILAELREAAARVRDAEDDLEDAINEARDVGLTASQIDSAMKVTR